MQKISTKVVDLLAYFSPTINFWDNLVMNNAKSKQIHDRFCKWLMGKNAAYPAAALRWKMGEKPARIFNWDTLRGTSSAAIDIQELQERLPDGAWTLAVKGAAKSTVYVLLEHKSYRDAGTLKQTMACHDLLRQSKKKPVLSFVLYHGEEAWDVDEDFASAFAKNSNLEGGNATINLLRAMFSGFFYLLIDLPRISDKELLTVPYIGIALYVLKHIRNMKKAKIARLIRHSYRLPHEHRQALMWGIMCYVQAAYPQFDREVFHNLGDKVCRDMIRKNPSLKQEESMAKTLSFDFEDALAEREAEGLAKGEAEGLAKGEAEGRRKVALRLLKSDVDEETIRQATKLTKRQLKLLKEEANGERSDYHGEGS